MTPVITWAICMAIAITATIVFLKRNGEFANFKSRGK